MRLPCHVSRTEAPSCSSSSLSLSKDTHHRLQAIGCRRSSIPNEFLRQALPPARRPINVTTRAFSGVAVERAHGSGGDSSDFNFCEEEILSTVNPFRDELIAPEGPLFKRGSQPWPQPRTVVPVYVMLPLDTVRLTSSATGSMAQESYLRREEALNKALDGLRPLGVEGVMVDVWWGIVQHGGEDSYDFTAYRRLFEKVREKGLRVQAVMSFHAAGNNVGDICNIPLPAYVLEAGRKNPDIFYQDRAGNVNEECLSLACDEEPIFSNNETPLDKYRRFIEEFVKCFKDWIGVEEMITEITVGMGPAGELRYPSYPEGKWCFPGVGEFQCYDKYMRRSLELAAQRRADQALAEALDNGASPEEAREVAEQYARWGLNGPHDSGHYNSRPWECWFFQNGGAWDSEYGRFFLSWYSEQLARHGDRMLTVAEQALTKHLWRPYRALHRNARGQFVKLEAHRDIWRPSKFVNPGCHLGAKLAGIHWYYRTDSHAAELTAGYYNAGRLPDGSLRNGYLPLLKMLKRHGAHLSFTCVEMRDADHTHNGAWCSPEGLLEQVIRTAHELGVPIAGENALQRYDTYAFEQIANNVGSSKVSDGGRSESQGKLNRLTFLRMNDVMLSNFGSFKNLMERLNPNYNSETGDPGPDAPPA